MKRIPVFATFFLCSSLVVLPAIAGEAAALSLDVLVDGLPVAQHAARGRSYVEAIEGREYSIRVTNHEPRRVAVALSVDGLNTIDAKSTSAREASKWILDPGESITIDGWQTSGSTARRFYFTSEDRSYGAWLGRRENLGLISAAVFRERPRPSRPIVVPLEPGRSSGPSARSEAAPRSVESEDRGLAATGIGREVDHRVRRVRFDAEPDPAARVELRYEYRSELVRLGVLPAPCPGPDDPLARRERSRGFDDGEFAPDPFRADR
ncbi:MAG TPA: hypothetical protein VD788_07440 [Candidatus Polarisedimenticolaceae bacterium]|nr:hypothetical protein [Candidatus Polarisedimenticolaceae bacterium]